MSKQHKIIFTLLFVSSIAVILAAIIFWMVGGFPLERIHMMPVIENSEIKAAKFSGTLRVMSYNIHFGIGRDDDHNKQTYASIIKRLEKIAKLANTEKADIVLLQEVDFASRRTYNIDQMKEFARFAQMKYMAYIITWKKGFVPHPPTSPPWKQFGKMLSGQAVFSRFPIVFNQAFKMPKPASNPFWYNAFYLDRTLQHVKIDLGYAAGSVAGNTGKNIIDVFNIHTEAYDVANRQLHADLISDYYKTHAVRSLVMAGDFNAVPPEATLRHNFPDEPDNDMSLDESVQTIRKLGLSEIIPPKQYLKSEKDALTYPADYPNRRLDYLYFSSDFKLVSGRILTEAKTLSDHLPTFAELVYQPQAI